MVDMVTSKNSPYGRVIVTVLDSKAIPEQLVLSLEIAGSSSRSR